MTVKSTDKEYSYDAYFGGTYHGAMTFYALQAIRSADYQLTYAQLHACLGNRSKIIRSTRSSKAKPPAKNGRFLPNQKVGTVCVSGRIWVGSKFLVTKVEPVG